MTSANSSEFLDPIYKALEKGELVVVQFALSRHGGLRNEWLVRTKKEFDDLRVNFMYAWRPQARVCVSFNPVVVWDGPIVFETTQLLWLYPQKDFDYCDKKDGIINYVDYEVLAENKGKDVLIIEGIQWSKEQYYAYVPMEDGTIKPGAY